MTDPGFNDKFETISGGNSDADGSYGHGNAGEIPLKYNENNRNNSDGIYTSTLITTEPERNSLPKPRVMSNFEGDYEPFKINAKTDTAILDEHMEDWWKVWVEGDEYSECYMNINLGLCERVLELSIKTDIDTAKLEINGKETTYIYDQIRATGGLLINMEDAKNSYDHKKYNLNLYRSDYYYRIEDYVTAEQGRIENQVYDDYIDIDEIDTDQEIDAIPEEEMLDIYVTYRMLITNHTNHANVIINEIVDYYDINYEYMGGELRDANGITVLDGEIDARTDGTRNIEGKTYNKLVISNVNNNQTLGANGSRWIFVTFKVTPNPNENNGNGGYQPIHLQEGESHPQEVVGYIEEKPEYKQIVNITKYSTPEEGFIDRKAAPGIVVEDGDEQIHHTNHSDEAPGLVIQFNKNDREITGSVWDDTNNSLNDDQTYKVGDGIYSDNNGINDVIVQLIELKEVTAAGKTKQFEYIWQETKSGSNTVKSLKLNGETLKTKSYATDTVGAGGYKFEAFQPGNYIVRYIYGDGSTRDVTQNSVTENIRKYNGNDYQSTVDAKYNNPNFDYSYNDNGTRNNDARDNEARRLEVMEKTALVNNEIGTKLDAITQYNITDNNDQRIKDGLDMTWMCAETSIMDIAFEDYEEITDNGDYPDREIEGNEVVQKPGHYYSNIANLDFGLQLRPVNVLELEKHLVGLNITVDGVGPILDARIAEDDEDDKVANTEELDADYGKDDLMIIGTADRGSRGQWYFQTNTDELARGAELEATYRYIVHNKGEIDYLSAALVNKYTKKGETIGDYKESLVSEYDDGEVAAGLAYEVKTAMKNWKNTGRNITYNGNLKAYAIGDYLGRTYYTGNTGEEKVAQVPARAEIIEEALNNELSFNVASGGQAGVAFEKVGGEDGGAVNRVVYNTDGNLVTEQINTIVKTVEPTDSLNVKDKDNTKEIVLTRGLNTTNVEEELLYDSYIAEIFEYSNAAGRRDAGTIGEYPKIDRTEEWDGSAEDGAVPGQLRNTNNTQIVTPSDSNPGLGAGYVHSNAGEHTLKKYISPTGGVKLANEHDEFWAESIKITGPTGVTDEVQLDNNLNMTAIIGVPVLIILAGAIILIVKFVVIKK